MASLGHVLLTPPIRSSVAAQLLMPRLGEPAEPAQARELIPWWRQVDNPAAILEPTGITTLPEAMPWPID